MRWSAALTARQSTFLSVPSLRDMGLSRESGADVLRPSRRARAAPAARVRGTGGPLGISVDSVSEIVPHLIILHV